MPFSNLGLSPKALDGVRAAGYTDPTPIQLRAIPIVMTGRDLIGSAQTGTGKTAVFVVVGRVQVQRPTSGDSVLLRPGQGVDVDRGSGPLTVRRWPAARVSALMARLGE